MISNLTQLFISSSLSLPISKAHSHHFMQCSQNTETQLPTNQFVFGERCSTLSWAMQSNRMQQLKDQICKENPMTDIFKASWENGHPFCLHLKGNLPKTIQDSLPFCISGILHSKKISAHRLGNKTLFPLLCFQVIKGLFVLILCGSLKKKENFHFPYNGSCAFRNYKYPCNNPMWNLFISDTYFPQKHSHNEREIAFHKGNYKNLKSNTKHNKRIYF